MDKPEIVLLPQRHRNELPRWGVVLGGERLGEIETVRIGGAVSTFYRALAVLPGWRLMIDLELDTDREGQARKLVEFRADPTRFERHLPYDAKKFLFGKQES